MITTINDANRKDITALMKYVLVPLNILLSEEDITAKLIAHAPKNESSVNTRDAIISHIFEILTDTEFSPFRSQAAKLLKEHELFRHRSALACKLSKSAQKLIPDLIEALKKCDLSFMNQFNALLRQQDIDTRNACEALIKRLIQILVRLGKHTYPATYPTCIVPQIPPHHDPQHYFPALYNFGQQVIHTLNPAPLVWGFANSVSSIFHNPLKRPATEPVAAPAIAVKKSKKQRRM